MTHSAKVEQFRMKLERLMGYCTMHGRDRHADADAWGDTIRKAHRDLIDFVEPHLDALSPASTEEKTK